MKDPNAMKVTHFYRWAKYRPDWKGRACRVLARGRMNSALIEFTDGERAVVSRFAVRRLARQGEGGGA